jgi:hypothetical protein
MSLLILILAVLALVSAVVSAAGYCPLFVSVILLAVLELVVHVPIGK